MPNVERTGFDIRLARAEDAPLIWELQHKNLYSLIGSKRRANGFVRIESSLKHIEDIIEAEAAVVAFDTKFAGYYILAGCAEDKEPVSYLHSKAKSIRYKNQFVADYVVGYGTQVCINSDFRGKGLAQTLFRNMAKISSEKYDLLMGSVTKENIKAYHYNIENCDGIVVDEDKERWYVVFDLLVK